MMSDPSVRPLDVEHLVVTFADRDNEVRAVDDVSFEIRDGELYTLLGPSGCGKTTTLRAVAGLERPDGGRISIAGHLVSDADSSAFVPPNKRDSGMVFQSYGIWPHMTVFENVAFPLRVGRTKWPKAQIRERVEQALAAVQLHGYEDRMSTQLSGGQQQRLALARALIRQPRLLLLDEPLSNLDAKLREAMRTELLSLQRDLGITTLYVTHDQAEALSMSSRIAVMAEGRVVQEGTPREIYERPATRFVADFIGTTNFVEGTVIGVAAGTAEIDSRVGQLVVATGQALAPDEEVVVALRPEAVRLHLEDPGQTINVVRGTLDRTMFFGESVECHIQVGPSNWVTRADSRLAAQAGASVWLELPADALSVIRGGAAA